MDWLELHSPMEIHWAEKWLQFTHCQQLIKLQGILPSTNLGANVSLYQLQALDKTDTILYFVKLQALDTNLSTNQIIPFLPPDLQDVLH